MKRLGVDLVIINERASSYQQDLQIAIETAVRTSQSRPHFGEELAQGSVYVLRADLMTAAAQALLLVGRPRRARRPPREHRRPARTPAAAATGRSAHCGGARLRCPFHRPPLRNSRRWSSSTDLAASTRTAANM